MATKKLPVEPNYVMKAICTSVIDGDTVVLTVSPAFKVYHSDMHFRLLGINAPELKATDPAVRKAAQASKKFVSDAILNKEIMVQSVKVKSGEKLDKYGRYLGVIYYVDAKGVQVDLNKQLVSLGLAVPFMD